MFVQSELMTGLLAETTIAYGARSDAGRVRPNNEDSFLVAPELNLFVLSDGMGGMASGEVASRLTVETIVSHCREADRNPALPCVGADLESVSETSRRLLSATHQANSVVHRAGQRNAAQRGMGATVVAARLHQGRLSVVNVGDSRAYRLRGDRLEQLTRDHSFIAEQIRQGRISVDAARDNKLQNILVRAIGAEDEVEVDIDEHPVTEGDIVLLCTDGLTRELSDARIASVLRGTDDAQEAADLLVDLANRMGGEDNITALVLHASPRTVGGLLPFRRLGSWLGRRENEMKGASVKWQKWS